ncbi:MAG: SDH family Clp fold serine proteinase [Rhodospirillales bacterium]
MPNAKEPSSSDAYTKGPETVREDILSLVLEEHDLFRAQRAKRQELLTKMERHTVGGKKSAYLGFFCSESLGAAIDSDDIPALGDALLSIGQVDQLNLIINSPGGDGTVAEKIIELCRAYCTEFRVFVPNRAKSAATIIALGADEIVMGYCSELGPIDAQVVVMVGGIPRYISAQSFIDARQSLEQAFRQAVAKKEDPRAILQQIASLDIPFIDHCEKLMGFSREVARKYLANYMFKSIRPIREQKKAIELVLKGLSSVGIFKVHGRMIDGNTAKADLKLNVRLLGKDDPLWKELWQYYVRADVQLSRPPGLAKLVETKNEVLFRR